MVWTDKTVCFASPKIKEQTVLSHCFLEIDCINIPADSSLSNPSWTVNISWFKYTVKANINCLDFSNVRKKLTCTTAAEGSNQKGYVKSTTVKRSALIVMPLTARSFSCRVYVCHMAHFFLFVFQFAQHDRGKWH